MIYSQKKQQLSTATSLNHHCEHLQKRKSRTRMYQVMLKALIICTVTDLENVSLKTLLAFVRTSTLHGLHGESLNDFCRFISPALVVLRVLI
jgi:hypothetical protein